MSDKVIFSEREDGGFSQQFFEYFLKRFETINLAGLLETELSENPFPMEKGLDVPSSRKSQGGCVWFSVADFEAEYQKLRDRRVKFLIEPVKIKNGFAVEFEDRFGNRWGITDYLHSRNEED